MQTEIEVIDQIIERTLGRKPRQALNYQELCRVDEPTNSDPLELIKYYLQNPLQINASLIAELVRSSKKYGTGTNVKSARVSRWDLYLMKLEQLLAQVKYRREQNFEWHDIMPTQEELMELQEECLSFTEEWYGAGNGNISCLYNYFIQMCQIAGVTCFEYKQISKYVSSDQYLSLIDREERHTYFLDHEQKYNQFIAAGGVVAQGRSPIDATYISNVLYYKRARIHFYHDFIKKVMCRELELENYGQVPYTQRLAIWHLLQQYYETGLAADNDNIFFQFVEYINERPGENFNYFGSDLGNIASVDAAKFHDIVKVAGIQSNYLCLLPRATVDNWLPKRHLSLRWTRRYPLEVVDENGQITQIRAAGVVETSRILPNELPYAACHGLALCGNGLLEGADQRQRVEYEWNSPQKQTDHIDNWSRDIEKIFRELRFFCPKPKIKTPLFGEKMCNIFLNAMAISTIHVTQHTHITASGLDKHPLYLLPGEPYVFADLEALFEIVQIGTHPDAIYVRIKFADIDNEPLLQFLLKLNQEMYLHFGGHKNIDVHLHLFATLDGLFFIMEPHAFLEQLEYDKFYNPCNERMSARKPQLLQPEVGPLKNFVDEHALGLGYLRQYFDDTLRTGTRAFLENFIAQNLR